MKRNNFLYFIKEGVRDLFLHGFMSFAAICVIVACLIIMGTFVLVMMNIQEAIVNLEQDNEILVYIDDTYAESEAKSVGSQINMIENVLEASFISREQAMENFVEKQEDPDLFAGVDESTLRHRFSVRLVDINLMANTLAEIEQIPGVARTRADQKVAEGFAAVRSIVNVVSGVIILVLFVVSVFIISNTVKLALFSRREEISIMKMVGATNWFIRWPFVVEGMLLGLTGALVSFFAEWGLYELMIAQVNKVDTLEILEFIPFANVLMPMVTVFCVIGFLVGVGGSLLSIRKFLKV